MVAVGGVVDTGNGGKLVRFVITFDVSEIDRKKVRRQTEIQRQRLPKVLLMPLEVMLQSTTIEQHSTHQPFISKAILYFRIEKKYHHTNLSP